VQRPGVFVGVDRQWFSPEHRAGIQPSVHLHDRNAGFAVAGKQSALNRRGTAPARQQGGVNVERAEARSFEKCGREKQSVSGYDQRVWPQGADFPQLWSILQLRWLPDWNSALGGEALHRARRRPQAAARRAVRLCQNQLNFVTRAEQAGQRPSSELGRTGED
jgi:hypothetical protein